MANFIPKIEYTELYTGTPKTITFEYPPEGDPIAESFKPKSKASRSSGGSLQVQYNYTLYTRKIKFLFQSQTIKELFDTFFTAHASRGGEFNYFTHSDEVEFETYTMMDKTYSPKRPIPNATGDFEYDISFKIERVL